MDGRTPGGNREKSNQQEKKADRHEVGVPPVVPEIIAE